MTALAALWLPILVSAVIVFIASSIIHMAPLWHRGDYPKLPNEEAARNAIRPLAIPPGEYLMPRASGGAEFKTPEFQEKVKQGPLMMLTVMNGPVSMGRNLILWFLYCIAVSGCAGYITSKGVAIGAPYPVVFKWIAASAFLGYVAALWQGWIWYWRSFSLTIKGTIDGLIYALLTAGTFGWLWPR